MVTVDTRSVSTAFHWLSKGETENCTSSAGIASAHHSYPQPLGYLTHNCQYLCKNYFCKNYIYFLLAIFCQWVISWHLLKLPCLRLQTQYKEYCLQKCTQEGWRDSSVAKAPAALAEAQGWVPSIHMEAHNLCNSRSRGSHSLFYPPWALPTHGIDTYMEVNTHTYKAKIKNSF